MCIQIELSHIYKSFEETKVFEDYFRTFEAGRINVVMAPSGGGKTTLLNMIVGIEKPDKGTITYSQKPQFAMVFQEDRLIEHTDICTNIMALCPVYTPAKRTKCISEIEDMLTHIGMEGMLKAPVSSLSGGMKRRVAILRALYAPSNILIMDEPFKGLDSDLKRKVMEYVKEKSKGKTTIIVTHDISEKEFFEQN